MHPQPLLDPFTQLRTCTASNDSLFADCSIENFTRLCRVTLTVLYHLLLTLHASFYILPFCTLHHFNLFLLFVLHLILIFYFFLASSTRVSFAYTFSYSLSLSFFIVVSTVSQVNRFSLSLLISCFFFTPQETVQSTHHLAMVDVAPVGSNCACKSSIFQIKFAAN